MNSSPERTCQPPRALDGRSSTSDVPVDMRKPVIPELNPDERQSNPTTKETSAPVMSARNSSHLSSPSSQSCICRAVRI